MVGKTLGHYEILEPLGAGGMGEVYRARDTKLGREVAVKVLPEDFATDPDRLARFEREAKLLASLNHTNIAAIYGLEDEGEQRFIVMEVVEGETLAERLARSGRIEVDEALDIARQIAEALEAAHENGVIHRDVKPANVLLTPKGGVKVLDFGIAKSTVLDAGVAETELATSLTMDGTLMGTPPYMSPEQIRGEEADKRADIWAFGCVLYEMLTGRGAFVRETVADTLVAVLESEPDWGALPSSVPSDLESPLKRCLRKDPNRRLRDIGDARIEIEEAMREPDGGRAGHAPETLVTSGWRRGAMPIVGSIVAGLILGTVATLTFVTRAVDRSASANEPLYFGPLPDGIVPNVFRGGELTISPDGHYVVFEGRGEDQVLRLYKRNLRDGTTARIPGVETGWLPFFSPDSESFGFFSVGGVWKVPVGGGTPENLADVNNARGGTWGPDGNIVYAWGPTDGLHKVPAIGGGSELLTERLSFWNPSFLPDGKSLLATHWVTYGKGDFDIILVDLETGERQSLGEVGVAPQYLPSGHIIFGRGRDLYAARFDLDSRQILGDPVPVVRRIGDGNEAPREFAVSEGGVLVYIQQGEAQLREIVKVDMEGNAEPYGIRPDQYMFPRVSPDGTRVSVTTEEIHHADVWIVELLDGGVRRRLTNEYINQMPQWVDDGASVIYEQFGPDELQHIYRRPADRSGAAEHVYSYSEHGHSWFGLNSVSADGAILLGISKGPPVGLAYVSLENPSEMNLFVEGREEAGARLHTARISPDGERVAYISNETGTSQVYVTTFPDSGPKLMVSSDANPGDALHPLWAPDGSGVYYTQGGQMRFVELDPDPAARPIDRRPLFDTSGYRARGNYVISNWDIFPDGKSFLMLRDVGDKPAPPQMKIIVNFFERLERLLPAPGGQ